MKSIYIWPIAFWAWLTNLILRRYKGIKVEGAYPPTLKPRNVYILTEDGEAWEGKMVCPCGCKSVLDLNFIPDDHPCWQYTIKHNGNVTLTPSVWRQVGCRAHFFVRDGKILWS